MLSGLTVAQTISSQMNSNSSMNYSATKPSIWYKWSAKKLGSTAEFWRHQAHLVSLMPTIVSLLVQASKGGLALGAERVAASKHGSDLPFYQGSIWIK
jgi:hypothetical protein